MKYTHESKELNALLGKEEEAKEKFEKLYGWIKGNKPMTHGCDKEYCFYPEICETNRVCLECKYCIYADLIKDEIDKKNSEIDKKNEY